MSRRLMKQIGMGVAATALALIATGAVAHESSQLHLHEGQTTPHGGSGAALGPEVTEGIVEPKRTVIGETYRPTIWIDPDGCEHWVMDDGREGYMTPHTNRQGIPVCHRTNACGVMNTDKMFASGSARLGRGARAGLKQFFSTSDATAFVIVGHTDSRASDDYNLKLSYRRASAVATVAQRMGRRVSDVRGHGERNPVAPNTTAHGMAKNRRVEILCIR